MVASDTYMFFKKQNQRNECYSNFYYTYILLRSSYVHLFWIFHDKTVLLLLRKISTSYCKNYFSKFYHHDVCKLLLDSIKFATDKCLSAVNFSADLGKTIQNICLNKTHEHGDISVYYKLPRLLQVEK